tara:strand:- start:715 stop:2370 length:1656 start_codon:yes stop_codon:yes gene_type:complete
MADDIDKLAGSLSDLNSTLSLTDTKTLGFIRKVGELSVATSKSGRAWTTFSRLVSGSPIWSVQNKLRAYIDIFAGLESRARENAKAQQESNQRIIDQVQSYKKLEPQLKNLQKLKDDLEGGTPFVDAEARENIEEAVKGTLAFNRALLEGKTAEEQFAAGLDELIDKGKKQTEIFTKAQEAVQAKLKFETYEGRDEIKGEIQSRRTALKEAPSVKVEKIFQTMTDRLTSIRKFVTGNYTVSERIQKDNKRRQKVEDRRVKREILQLKISQGMFKISQMVKPMLNIVFKFLIFSIFAFMAILLFLKFASDAFAIMKELGILDDLRNIFYTSIEMLGAFFGLVGAFFAGDYQAVLDYLMTLLDGTLSILWSLAKVGFKLFVGLLVGFFYTILDNISIVTKKEFWIKALPVLKKFGKILLLAYFVRYIATQVALLIGIYALPAMMAIVILAALWAVAKWITGKINPFKRAMGGTVGANEGMTLVGENGPELVSLPSGSKVHTNSESKRMGGGNTINITINARDTSDAELRRIADKIGNMVNNKINRRTSSRTLG